MRGSNGQGKTNLLEAIYLLAIGKSPRASTDREMVSADALDDFRVHAQVAGDIATSGGDVRLQVDLSSGASDSPAPSPPASETERAPRRIHKTFRVNGVPKRSSDFVGILKAVSFAAEDLDLISGPPSLRRRYADILVSQITPLYTRELQEYQRALTQRNHLLKSVRVRDSQPAELDFWDTQLAISGGRVVSARARAIRALDETARVIHSELSGSPAPLSLSYAPSVEVEERHDAREISRRLLDAIRSNRRREIAAGFSLIGPHRDDFTAAIDGMEVGAYASRGQSRIVALAMKMGEARLIEDATGERPVILLDDVMSELDPARRKSVFDRTEKYEQVIVTTAEPALLDDVRDRTARRISITEGKLSPNE